MDERDPNAGLLPSTNATDLASRMTIPNAIVCALMTQTL